VVALGAVGLVASGGGDGHGPQRRTSNRELALAGAAGAGFGVSFIFLAESGSTSGFWPVLAARAVSAPLALLVASPGGSLRISRGTRLQVVASGTLDAAAIALYLLASRRGLISLVAALGSLYPAATVLLARVVLHERLVRTQLVGLLLALVGVLLIAR
jgi:drug/metabolite transporter (DMT)-like permease